MNHPATSAAVFLLSLLFVLSFTSCSKETKKANHLEQAESAYASGDYFAARIGYLNVLESNADNETALIKLGAIWIKRGSPVQALPYLLAAKRVAPENLDVRTDLATALIAIGQRAEALNEIRFVLDRDPQDKETAHILCQLAQTPSELEDAFSRCSKLEESAPGSFHLCLATLALKQGDAEVAEKELGLSLAVEPDNHLARLGFASILASRNEHPAAVAHFEAAEKHLPAYSPARSTYARYLGQRGDIAGARTRLKAITQEVPDHLPAQSILAQIYAQESSYDLAATVIERILTIDPTHLEAVLLRGRVLRATGKPQKALVGLLSAQETDLYQDNSRLHFEIGKTYLALKDTTQALASLTKATASAGARQDARLLLASLHVKTGSASAAKLELEEVLKTEPDHRQARAMLGECHLMLGQLKEAAITFQSLVIDDPTDLAPRVRLASVLQAQNNLASAKEHYLKAAELAPNNAYIFNQLLELDLLEGNYAAGHAKADQLLATKGMRPYALFQKARIFYAEKKWSEAIDALKRCRDLGAQGEDQTSMLISCYLKSKQFDLARELLKEFTTKIEGNPKHLLAAALYHEDLGEYSLAKEFHERVLALAPDSIPSLNNLAVLHSAHFHDFEKARAFAERARKLAPDDGIIAETLGWIHYQQGDYRQALALIGKAAPALADNLEAQEHLGLAAYAMARADLAVPALTKVAAAHPDSPSKPRQLLALLADYQSSIPANSAQDLAARLEESPHDVIALLLLARLQAASDDFAGAEKTLLRVLEINKALTSARSELAGILAKNSDRLEEARALAVKARDADPDNLRVALTLARISFLQKNYAYAIQLYAQCARTSNLDASSLFALGISYQMTDSPNEAAATLTKALELNLPEADATAARQALEDLKNPELESTP